MPMGVAGNLFVTHTPLGAMFVISVRGEP